MLSWQILRQYCASLFSDLLGRSATSRDVPATNQICCLSFDLGISMEIMGAALFTGTFIFHLSCNHQKAISCFSNRAGVRSLLEPRISFLAGSRVQRDAFSLVFGVEIALFQSGCFLISYFPKENMSGLIQPPRVNTQVVPKSVYGLFTSEFVLERDFGEHEQFKRKFSLPSELERLFAITEADSGQLLFVLSGRAANTNPIASDRDFE
ncbi:hypothetical protein BJ742DRAFT_743675 [Cladochytrium replicatum]|nr:hypothetical protein BJ742DRAFT_743675 [Cladochytrium replicatum]